MPRTILKYLLLVFILFAGIASDQLGKRWAADHLRNQPTRIFVKNVIDLGYTENHGMVFGINNRADNVAGKNALLIVRLLLSIGLTIYIIMNSTRSAFFHLPFLLILSGAIGNVIDSLRYGHVIDFIHLHLGRLIDWPFLFNLADAYVVFGMGILIIQSFLTDHGKQPSPPVSTVSGTER